MGFRPKLRTREVVCTGWPALDPEDGSEPLKATIVISLTPAEKEAIGIELEFVEEDRRAKQKESLLIKPTGLIPDLQAAIAPYVLAWNAEALDKVTGEMVLLDPPAVAGPDVLKAVPLQTAVWLGHQLKYSHILALAADDDQKKESAPPESTGSNPSSGDGGRKELPAKRRRRQTDSSGS